MPSPLDGGARVGRQGDLLALVRRMAAVAVVLLLRLLPSPCGVRGRRGGVDFGPPGGSGEISVLLGFPREVGWGPSVGLRMDLV